MSTTTASREQVLEEIEGAERFLLVTHEGPDGDALGSLIAMRGALAELGKDVVMFLPPSELPLPYEYAFLPLEGLVTELPDDLDERTLVFLDCGNVERNPVAGAESDGAHVLNIDHHHDNTRFGTVNHVDDAASCTAQIIWDLMGALGLRAQGDVADALYVGLVTDTGRFMYDNTGSRAHVMAADLIDAGVDTHRIYRHLYEGMPFAKLRLLARALENVQCFDDGRLTLSWLSAPDFAETGSMESYSEGVIDHLRAVEGTKVAALIRDRLGPGRADERKVSLRATDDDVDVSRIARAQGGGGHRRAAGFTTQLGDAELVRFLRAAIAEQLA
ncbi:MAG TPA: DHH family phosphoesterase [Solirubrobacteraceae bacterium]